MQKLSVSMLNIPVYSLQTGHPIAVALRPLINPTNLKIEAWFTDSNFVRGHTLVPVSEIREFHRQGIAVNDTGAITPAEDLIRLQQCIELDFQLLGKKVYSETKVYLGKVTDFATDLESFFIQRLYVAPHLLKQLRSDQKIISRTQIVEINDKKIIVRDADVKVPNFFKVKAPAPAPEG